MIPNSREYYPTEVLAGDGNKRFKSSHFTSDSSVLQRVRTLGSITYCPYSVIGKGSSEATKIYKGECGGREVAIKRINCDLASAQLAEQEINILKKCFHDNIINYYNTQVVDIVHDTYIVIALELCDCSLLDWVRTQGNCLPVSISEVDIVHQICKGVAYLHTRKNPIIHRDIKPGNILLKVNERVVNVKISDFGISRVLPEDRTSLTVRTSSGTDGWQAPEILQLMEQNIYKFKMSQATDIFSLGCLIFFVLSKGTHPFGEGPRRSGKILDNITDLSQLEKQPKYTAAVMLIRQMIRFEPDQRISATSVLDHVMFWTKQKSLDFIIDVSNNITDKLTLESKECIDYLEEHSKRIIETCSNDSGDPNWISSLCDVVKAYINSKQCFGRKQKKMYDGSLVWSLIRAIRNVKEHYADLPVHVKNAVGELHDQYLDYWSERFPLLLPKLWMIIHKLKDSPVYGLRKYYAK